MNLLRSILNWFRPAKPMPCPITEWAEAQDRTVTIHYRAYDFAKGTVVDHERQIAMDDIEAHNAFLRRLKREP